MSAIHSTLRLLEKMKAEEDEILVGYSGGKDSLVVMDLCAKTFSRVKAVYFYTVPGLEVIEKQMRYAKARWGVDVVRIPDFRAVIGMKDGIFCDAVPVLDKVPEFGLKEQYALAMEATKASRIAVGMKAADGLKRRQFFGNIRDSGDPVWDRLRIPIKDWRKKDVLDYLDANGIPRPDAVEGSVTSGVGLDHDSICWLRDNHPQDFQLFLKWFPYAEACIKRREWFGVR